MSEARYAAYYAPPVRHPLWDAASAWLGRDAVTGQILSPPPLADISPTRIAEITATARRYGVHATLKPPFRLATACTPEAIGDALAAVAARHRPFRLPQLRVASIAGFIALVPVAPCAALSSLAADCVRTLDPLRAPPDAQELARRRAAGLSDRQQDLLARWGYPYVMDEYRFHITLTDALDDAERSRLLPALGRHFAPVLADPPAMADICLFEQAAADAPFLIRRRVPLTG